MLPSQELSRFLRPRHAGLDHIIVSSDGGGFRGFIDDLLQEKGLTRSVGISVQYYSVVPLILRTTDLVARCRNVF